MSITKTNIIILSCYITDIVTLGMFLMIENSVVTTSQTIMMKMPAFLCGYTLSTMGPCYDSEHACVYVYVCKKVITFIRESSHHILSKKYSLTKRDSFVDGRHMPHASIH